jgi:hypothetical protein
MYSSGISLRHRLHLASVRGTRTVARADAIREIKPDASQLPSIEQLNDLAGSASSAASSADSAASGASGVLDALDKAGLDASALPQPVLYGTLALIGALTLFS